MSKNLIDTVLITDSKFRYEGVEEDIFTHNDLQTGIVPEFEYPTLVNNVRFSNNQFNFNYDTFLQNFRQTYELLSFIFDPNLGANVLLAGGCISNAIYGNYDSNSDSDIFIYGLTPEQATQKAIDVLSAIVDRHKSILQRKYQKELKMFEEGNQYLTPYRPNSEYYVMRNKHTISLIIDEKYKYQVILRLYKSASEILHGFDMGSAAVGFNGKHVLFTTLSKFAYEYHANIIDTTRRSTTYEIRLQKYFNRGFAIVLPNLNIDMLRHPNLEYNLETVCKMPQFVFSYVQIAGKHVVIKNIYTNYYSVASDYDDVAELNQYCIFHRNLGILNNPKRTTDNFISYSYNNVDINSCIYLPIAIVHEMYSNLRSEMINRKVSVGRLARYFPVVPIANLANLIISSKWVDDGKVLNEDERRDTIDMIIEQQIQYIEEELQRVKNKCNDVEWQVKNPGTQLTSSINPIMEDPIKWYGQYYI